MQIFAKVGKRRVATYALPAGTRHTQSSPACRNHLPVGKRHLDRELGQGRGDAARDCAEDFSGRHSDRVLSADQFREFGTDVLTFLAQARGSNEADRLTTWLAELSSKMPTFAAGLESTPAMSLFEPLAAMASTAWRWVEQQQVSGQAARWLAPLADALMPLAGVAQIPPGPALLNVLQDAERGALMVLEQATGHLPTEAQARAIAERLRDWLRVAVTDLIDAAGLRVRSAPASLAAGSFAEFSVEVENEGALPLRSVRVETSPDWGIAQVAYLAEHVGSPSTFVATCRSTAGNSR